MYSIRVYFVHPRKGLIVRYLTYETRSKTVDAIETLQGIRESKHYTKSLYLDVATITRSAIGELFSDKSIECDLLAEYLYKTI